ncbi:hypothetical protein ACH95_08270 [Bacillus glycinifermentans]|nr:hypothetical protein ACH95_08270 [Bacillus glycinifermentans]
MFLVPRFLPISNRPVAVKPARPPAHNRRTSSSSVNGYAAAPIRKPINRDVSGIKFLGTLTVFFTSSTSAKIMGDNTDAKINTVSIGHSPPY